MVCKLLGVEIEVQVRVQVQIGRMSLLEADLHGGGDLMMISKWTNAMRRVDGRAAKKRGIVL
jgi:hypothetical protein